MTPKPSRPLEPVPADWPVPGRSDPPSSGPKIPLTDGRFLDTAALFPLALRPLVRWTRPLLETLLGLDQLWALHRQVVRPPLAAALLADRVLAALEVTWEIDPSASEPLRALDGPVVLTSNHPCGGIEFFALVRLLEDVRPKGWKFLANTLVSALGPPLSSHLIPLDPLNTSPPARAMNRRGLAAALRHLRSGGLLAAFPAGRVSHPQANLGGALADRAWTPHLLQLAAKAGARVVCLHIEGRTSARFQLLPASQPHLRALFLCREFLQPASDHLAVRLASIRSSDELSADATGAARLRADCYLAADRAVPRPPVALAAEGPVGSAAFSGTPPSFDAVESELRSGGEGPLVRQGGFEVFFARGDALPITLQALGMARETTFQAAGQGTGQTVDLSEEDRYYHHLILWDRSQRCLCGAYRVGKVTEILDQHGPTGLYLDHVFRIQPSFYRDLGPAYELSRSFILPAYQRRPNALSSLWKGLGAAASREGVDTLFGSVTISAAHHPASQALLVEYLRQNHLDRADLCEKVTARRPFVPRTRYHRLVAEAYRGAGIGALSPLIRRIEDHQRDIPPLMRYYCGLGARFLAFHVEASFQDALYCLLRVSLSAMPPAYQKHFLPSTQTP